MNMLQSNHLLWLQAQEQQARLQQEAHKARLLKQQKQPALASLPLLTHGQQPGRLIFRWIALD